MRRMLASVVALAAAATPALADTITQWTFETSAPATAGPHAAEFGIGSALGFHTSTTAVYSSPVGNGSARSFSSNGWAVGDYYQFSTSSSGYEDLTVSFDQTSSNTGPRDFTLAWSTDNSTYTSAGDYVVLANATPNPTWSSGTPQPVFGLSFDLSGVPDLDNAATIYFRLVDRSTVSANGGTVAATGTDRVDNFTVSGTLIPEPMSLVTLSIGGMALLRRRR